MNIDTSRLTYNPIQRTPQPAQTPNTRPAKIDPAEVKHQQEITPQRAPEPKPTEMPETKQADWNAPLSNYLSPEEKAMLNQLFPPPGRDFGIRAYQKGVQPAPSKIELGKRIDITT